MIFDELKEKARTLPLSPGVYIMRDDQDCVIYVGKAKKLKNRVSQYFQDTASHSPKTRLMVSKIHHFDVIVAASEFEALVLECSLIKRYMPKYNILLKDDKGYPYIRINMKEIYPTISMVSKIADDGALYFGPYGSRSITQDILKMIRLTLRLPDCNKRFPRDIGRGRVCLNFHMNQCQGWCRAEKTSEEYKQTIEQAKQLLARNYKGVADDIRKQMLAASDALNFELAASLRDHLSAVEALGQKQLVAANSFADTDVVGYSATDAKACFAVLHFKNGTLIDKDYQVFPVPDESDAAVSSLLKQYYLSRGYVPKVVLLPFELEDSMLFQQLIEQQFGFKSFLKVPKRGNGVRLVALANTNAFEEANRVTDREGRMNYTLIKLSTMLNVAFPSRIEAFDISNISGSDIVASMVVFQDGKPKKSDYKRFKIEGLDGQDDYGAMRQAISRRFSRYISGDKGFEILPDLLLIDGGVNHASTAVNVLKELGVSANVFGMVKDNRHRTRSLVTPDGKEIGIDAQQSVYALIGNIQEETHRFAIQYHRKLRSKRLKYSELDLIPGIGTKRKQLLLKTFKSLAAIRSASLPELERILPADAAISVYSHFRGMKG